MFIIQDEKVGGNVSLQDKQFVFPTDGGLGLVEIDGKMTLIRFSCPFESIPPQGSGDIVSMEAQLNLKDGVLSYNGEPVVLGIESHEQ